jgi:hypothetical protein
VSRTPEEAAQEQLEAYNARDLEAFLLPYAPDAVLVRLPGGEVVAEGHPGMRAVYGKLFAEAPGLRCRLLARVVEGRCVVDHEEVTGLPGRDTVRAVAVYEVDDGLIRRVWFPRVEG